MRFSIILLSYGSVGFIPHMYTYVPTYQTLNMIVLSTSYISIRNVIIEIFLFISFTF